MFTCQFQCFVCVYHNLTTYLRDGIVDDAALLDTAGRGYAAPEYLGDTGKTIDVVLFLSGLGQQYLGLLA